MECPNCGRQMKKVVYINQNGEIKRSVYECSRCRIKI